MTAGSDGCIPVAVMGYWALFLLAPRLVLCILYCLEFSPKGRQICFGFLFWRAVISLLDDVFNVFLSFGHLGWYTEL
jgi:hypothetical protein